MTPRQTAAGTLVLLNHVRGRRLCLGVFALVGGGIPNSLLDERRRGVQDQGFSDGDGARRANIVRGKGYVVTSQNAIALMGWN